MAVTRRIIVTFIIKVILIPPVKAQAEEIGKENNTSSIKIEIEAMSFPIIISKGDKRVVNRLEKV